MKKMYRYFFSVFFVIWCSLMDASNNVWVLSVSIGTYQNGGENFLRDIKNSKSSYYISSIFEYRRISFQKAEILENNEATKNTILKAIDGVFISNPNIDNDDMIIFYFSGHGVVVNNKIGICPYDYVNPRYLITEDTIISLMNKSIAKHKICFLEACRTPTMNLIDDNLIEEFVKQRSKLTKSKGVILFTSTEIGRDSYCDEEIGGYFSHFLLKGLESGADENKDKIITTNELATYLEDNVSKKTIGAQKPKKFGDLNIPIMVVPDQPNLLTLEIDLKNCINSDKGASPRNIINCVENNDKPCHCLDILLNSYKQAFIYKSEYSQAQYLIAKFLLTGKHIKKNINTGLRFLDLAVKNQNPNAISLKKHLQITANE